MLWSVRIPPSTSKTSIVYPLQLHNVNVLIRISLYCPIFGKVSNLFKLYLHSSVKLELWRRLTTDNQNLKGSQSENKELQSSNPISLAFSATGVLARCVLIVMEWLRENAIVFATGALVSVAVAIQIQPKTADTGTSDPHVSVHCNCNCSVIQAPQDIERAHGQDFEWLLRGLHVLFVWGHVGFWSSS